MPILIKISPTGQPISFLENGEGHIVEFFADFDPDFTGSIVADSFQQYRIGNIEHKRLNKGNGFLDPWWIRPWENPLVAEDTFQNYEIGAFENGSVGGTFRDGGWGQPWKIIQYL